MSQSLRVAIDGPSGSGKSSVSQAVAEKLDAAYLDTGAMYRAATAWCLKQGLKLDDPDYTEEQLVQIVRTMPLKLGLTPGKQNIELDGEDVTDYIRTSEISSRVSALSTVAKVREVLVAQQREMVFSVPRIIAEGRDITTVVAPDSDVRILLTASEATRMARRGIQNEITDATALNKEISARDKRDSALVDFMTPAPGVGLIDSTELDLSGTVEAVLAEIARQTGTGPKG